MIDYLKSLNIHQYDCELIDIRIEEEKPFDLSYYQKELYNFSHEEKKGAFIRVYANKKWYFSSTTNINNIENEIHTLLKTAKISLYKNNKNIEYKEHSFKTIKDDFTFHLSKEEKMAFLQPIREIIENDPQVVTPYISWSDRVNAKYYINNKGIVYYYDKGFSGVLASITLVQDKEIFRSSFYKTVQRKEDFGDILQDFKEELEEGKLFLNAPVIEPGQYPVVMSPDVAGVFAHESFGHKSEADFMLGDETMKQEWEIGKKVGSDILSIVDCGLESDTTGFCPIDDEGVESHKTYLIKNGILTGRLHSKETADTLQENTTGNARAVDFTYEPIVRMTSTYIEAGDLTFDELIKPIENGYFLKTLIHGSGMSTFTMAINKAYKIENGKIAHPVKINMATGTVFETLFDIDGLSNKVQIKSSILGGCGKNEQRPLPVSFGGPYLRIKKLNLS